MAVKETLIHHLCMSGKLNATRLLVLAATVSFIQIILSRKYLNKTIMYRNKQVTKCGFRNTRSNRDNM